MIGRRKFIASVSTAGTVGLAGCSSALGSDSPEDVTEDFYTSLGSGDADEINAYIHQDSPEDGVTQEEAAEMEEMEITVEETELLSEEDDVAEVRVVVTVSFEHDGEEYEETNEAVIQLRTQEGDWKVWAE